MVQHKAPVIMKGRMPGPAIEKRKQEFTSLSSIKELSRLLAFNPAHLRLIALNPEYRSIQIPKRSKGYREIDIPGANHHKIQKRLNKYLQAVYYTIRPSSTFGFIIASRDDQQPASIITHAACHVGKEHLLRVDLADFFHTVKSQDILAIFKSSPFNFTDPLATILTLLTTYRARLPMGSPTSPVLSNFACLKLDEQLMNIATQCGLTYTRFADDLYFSSNTFMPDILIMRIFTIIQGEGFNVNRSKTRIASRHMNQSVTGLCVNDKVNINRKYIRNLRAIFHNISQYGYELAAMNYLNLNYLPGAEEIASFRMALHGKIDFIRAVRGMDDPIYIGFKNNLNSVRKSL